MLFRVLPVVLCFALAGFVQAERIHGFVKGSPNGKFFTLGSSNGDFKVDASNATIRMKRKPFAIARLTSGSQVTVDGTIKGKSIVASAVEIDSLRVGVAVTKVKPPLKPKAPTTAKSKTWVIKAPLKGSPKVSKPATAKPKPPVKMVDPGKSKTVGAGKAPTKTSKSK